MSYSSEVLADSPQVFFEFAETSGNATSSVGSTVATNNGGVTYSSNGPNGSRCVTFNGSNAFAFTTAAHMGGDYTYEVWAKPDASTPGISTILRTQGTNSTEATLRVNSFISGKIEAYASGRMVTSFGDYRDGWSHIAKVVTATSTTIYVNGIRIGSSSSGSRSVTAEVGGASAIGATPTGTEPFTGSIARVAIYPSALSQARLAAHYVAGTRTRMAATTYDAEVAADSPWGFWKGEDVSGTSITDSSGNGRTATLSGTADAYGQQGLVGLGFNTTDQYLTLPTATALQGSGKSVSVEMILTPTNLIGGNPRDLFGFGGETRFARVSDASRPHGVIQTALGDSNAGSHESASVLRNGSEYHLVWTYDAATGATVVYVNGTAAHSFTAATNGFVFSGAATILHAATTTRHTHGRIQRMALYPTALSSSRVAAHYAATQPPAEVTGTLAGTLPQLAANLSGGLEFSGTITATLPALGANLSGTSTIAGIAGDISAALPPLSGSLTGAYSDTATLTAILPPLSADLAGNVLPPPVTGTLAGNLPNLSASIAGQAFEPGTSGFLAGVLPALSAALSGDVLGREGFGLALDSSAVLTVADVLEPEPSVPAGTPSTVLHIVAPTVPAPTLVAGRPQ